MKLKTLLTFVALLGCLGAATPNDGATITSGGSTNAAGWVIAVHGDGNATLTVNQRGGSTTPSTFTVDPVLAKRFLAEAKAAQAAGPAPVRGCMKSMSFGTTMHVGYHGYISPDLKCPVAPAYRSLATDAGQIQQASGLSDIHRIRLMPGEMRQVVVPDAPTASPSASP